VTKKTKESTNLAGRRNEDPQLPLKQPTLTVSSAPIKYKCPLNFSFSGFQPKAPVYVYSDGKGVNTSTANEQGSGSTYFIGNDPPGTHVLEARDGFGHKAQASFGVY